MKTVYLTVLAALFEFAAAQPAAAQEGGYALNPGDVLEVSVWKEEGMERQILVLPDGMISFPLAGHVKAAGRTAQELEVELRKRIERYIPEPVITVSVPNISGNKIYVIGQVNRPGEYQATRQIDVMQALSLAGGLTAFADENDIKVLRRRNGRQTAIPFDYSSVKNGTKLELNVVLESGDIVVVPD